MYVHHVVRKMHSRITFVGLGNMGYSMAANLRKHGIKVAGFDTNKSIMEKFISENGGENYDSLESAAKESQAVITMLPNSKVVKQVWESASSTAKKGTYFIDSSTISPIDAQEYSKHLKSKGFIAADAPVSGGVMGAQKATLSFMVGCEKENYDKVKEFLDPMGKNFFYCGDNSYGQVAKICNNLCLGITMAGLSESLSLGVKLGIDPKVLSEIMAVSSARCWSLDTYNPIPNVMANVPSSRDYENGFSMELMTKDLKIAMECADKINLDNKLSKITLEQYEILKKYYPNKDFSFIYKWINDRDNAEKK
jgi:3-hydroxyisobutyrate dehydrogenase